MPTSPLTADTPSHLALPQGMENGGSISPIPTPLTRPDTTLTDSGTTDEDGAAETIPSTQLGAGAIYLVDDEEVTAAEDPDHASDEMSPLKLTVLTTLIIVFGFGVAYFVDDLRLGTFFLQPLISCYCPLTLISLGLCWIDWLNHDFIHPSWFLLLQDFKGQAIDGWQGFEMGSFRIRDLRVFDFCVLVSLTTLLSPLFSSPSSSNNVADAGFSLGFNIWQVAAGEPKSDLQAHSY